MQVEDCHNITCDTKVFQYFKLGVFVMKKVEIKKVEVKKIEVKKVFKPDVGSVTMDCSLQGGYSRD